MTIYFLELNLYSILPMIFFRLIGYKVYFLDCGKLWKKKAVLNKLSKAGLIWMSHQEYDFGGWGFGRDLYAQSMRIGRRLFALESFQQLVAAIDKEAELESSVYQRVFPEIRRPVELFFSMSQHLQGASKPNGKVWVPNTIINRSLLDAFPNISNLCPRMWTFFEWIFYLGGHAAVRLSKFVLGIIKRFFRSSGDAPENDRPSFQSDTTMLENVEVAYFPHQGIFFSGLFLKDHFYSAAKDSPFYYEKIAHFELNKYSSSECDEYYSKKNIKNYDWQSLPFNKSRAIKCMFRFFGAILRRGFGGFDIDLLVKYAFIAWSVKTAMLRLQNLPNLKIVLIGYDILFPQPLSAACRLAGIKTIAVQERMLPTWWLPPMLIDHYFVIGPEALDYMKSNALPGCFFHGLGPVRLKDHAKAHAPGIVSAIREKYSWIVLAMDFHSLEGWFENGRCVVNNWRINMVFYDHLLKLCDDFPDAFFLLRGRDPDTGFTKIPFFRERVSQFRAKPNLLILEDKELWTPFSSAASADIAIARQNSLADEMLALGKPVIFDDCEGYPSKVYDYGQDVIAYDYDDLKDKLTRFFADPERYNANLNGLRKKLYSVPQESIEKDLHRGLMNIWNTECASSNGIMPVGLRAANIGK